MNKVESNGLIAEFMGLDISELTDYQLIMESDFTFYLKYHSSWDWLMPVVEKCLISPEELGRQFDKHYDAIHDALWSINIESTYKAVVEFIKWYNENK